MVFFTCNESWEEQSYDYYNMYVRKVIMKWDFKNHLLVQLCTHTMCAYTLVASVISDSVQPYGL